MTSPNEQTPNPSRRAPSSHTVPMRVRELEDEARALELKLAGFTYRQIAAEVGCNVHTAHDRVKRALHHIVPADDVLALRQIEHERLEAQTRRLHEVVAAALTRTVVRDGETVAAPDLATALAAEQRLVSLSERRSKLLGLDTPVAQHVRLTVESEVDAELAELVEELAALDTGVEDPGSRDTNSPPVSRS